LRRCADAAAALALAALSCSPASPATEVKDALARCGTLHISAGDLAARLERVRFSDVTVSMDGPRALVVAMVEADGRLRVGGDAAVAYVGREAFEMERCAGSRWCPAGEQLPALRGVLATLPRLESALRSGAGAPVRVLAWQLRIERDRAPVGADYEVAGGEARRLRARWELARDGDRWSLAPR
jgi:hypothetical protein